MGKQRTYLIRKKPEEKSAPAVVQQHAGTSKKIRGSFTYRRDPVPKDARYPTRGSLADNARYAATLEQTLRREDSLWPGAKHFSTTDFFDKCSHRWDFVMAFLHRRPFPGGTTLYHGTNPMSILGILGRGFEISPRRHFISARLLGPGVYLAPQLAKAAMFAQLDHCEEYYILGCSLSPECRVHTVATGGDYSSGYPELLDAVLLPAGSITNGRRLRFSEYCVYDPKLIKVTHLGVFRKTA